MKDKDKTPTWIQGYACAIATVVWSHGPSTPLREALESAGLTSVAALRKAKIDEHDFKILRPLMKELTEQTEGE